MRQFFESGLAFLLVGVFCIAVSFIVEEGAVILGIGVFWIIMGIIVRGNLAKKGKASAENESHGPPSIEK